MDDRFPRHVPASAERDAAAHYEGHRQRLRERYVAAGLDAFHDYEAIELLLTFAIPRRDVKPLAKTLLERFHSFKGIFDAEREELTAVPGLGAQAAGLITLVKDLGSRYLKERAREKRQITCTRELIEYCMTFLGGLKDEHFCIIYLDAQNTIIEVETVQKGIVNQAVVYPRKVLESALKRKASAVILAHNHPSGHVKPSEADIRLTRTIQETARALDILVHDHIIVGENRFFSFREEGMMP